jgi:hypothetical protein
MIFPARNHNSRSWEEQNVRCNYLTEEGYRLEEYRLSMSLANYNRMAILSPGRIHMLQAKNLYKLSPYSHDKIQSSGPVHTVYCHRRHTIQLNKSPSRCKRL